MQCDHRLCIFSPSDVVVGFAGTMIAIILRFDFPIQKVALYDGYEERSKKEPKKPKRAE